jgi:hypothetical protein
MVEENALPSEVQRLIDDALASMDHVEVLFRVCRYGPVTAEWLARDAHIERAVVDRVLRNLEHARLVIADGAAFSVTSNPRGRAAVEQFAEMYNSRPVTLIRAVYARPSAARSFADAFRIRRDD